MWRGLWKLTWIEIKVFVREPMGLFGTVGIPVLIFIGVGRAMTGWSRPSLVTNQFVAEDLPVMAAVLMAISAVGSLVTIISIYREGGILKRLRATPLRPYTILAAHVIVKVVFTAVTMALLTATGRRYFAAVPDLRVVSFALALLFTTVSVLSVGFLIASVVPTARFAQPLTVVIFYPMLAMSGLFFPLTQLPPGLRALARVMPLTYAVSLLQGIWRGEPLTSHLWDVGAVVVIFAVCIAVSTRVFRWE